MRMLGTASTGGEASPPDGLCEESTRRTTANARGFSPKPAADVQSGGQLPEADSVGAAGPPLEEGLVKPLGAGGMIPC